MSGVPVPAEVAEAALHGSFCPKMCSHACPVAGATGRADALPWAFHRTVSDLATGRLALDPDVAHQLRGCTGCHACREPCVFDQDVPGQVRAARALAVRAGVADPAVADAVARSDRGRSPFGAAPVAVPPASAAPEVAVLVGCRDSSELVAAVSDLLAAAGVARAFAVPDGCCGAALADLGAEDRAHEREGALGSLLPEGVRVVALDPHCLPALRAGGRQALDLSSFLAELHALGRLRFAARAATVAYHDPCLLARDEGVLDPPRALLAATGATLVEPEHHGRATACSGAGMGMELLGASDAATVAAARARELDRPAVTACSGARRVLAAAGADVRDLAIYLAEHLAEDVS